MMVHLSLKHKLFSVVNMSADIFAALEWLDSKLKNQSCKPSYFGGYLAFMDCALIVTYHRTYYNIGKIYG